MDLTNGIPSIMPCDAMPEMALQAAATPMAPMQPPSAAAEAQGDDTNVAESCSELDIVINNVVCSFSVRCHLKLRDIALNGFNVEYRRENGMVTMRLRRPYTTASIWSSGRITCTGAISEPQAKVAARRYARCLDKLGFPVHFQNFRIVNVLGTCSMPWSIKIVNFSERHRDNASYEPELHPGVTYKMHDPKATMKIFSTGSITVTAASVNAVEVAIQRIYPLVHEFRTKQVIREPLLERLNQQPRNKLFPNNWSTSRAAKRPPTAAPASGYNLPITNIKSGMRREQPSPPPRSNASSSSSSSSYNIENICGNARRRAAECWASKLQKKRPRYNDAGSVAILAAGNLARTACRRAGFPRRRMQASNERRRPVGEINDLKEEMDDDDLHW